MATARYNLFNLMAANYNYFEGLTIRNTELAFWAGYKNITGASGITIKNCKLENIGRGVYSDWSGSKDFYIADNTFVGKFRPDILMGFTGREWQAYPEFGAKLVSEYAVKIYGQGHVVAYNYVAQFHDGIDIATYGNPDGAPNVIQDRLPVSIDFYNNDVTNVEDNCIETDGGAHNIRVFRNRCFNNGNRALSVQPMFGGPVYFIRNIVYDSPEGGALKLTASSAGIVVYHNTFLAPVEPMLLATSNLHFRNNLILGKSQNPGDLRHRIQYQLFEFGLQRLPSERRRRVFLRVEHAAVFDPRPFPGRDGRAGDAAAEPARSQIAGARRFKTLKEYSEATGQDRHSVMRRLRRVPEGVAAGSRSADAVQAGGFRFPASSRIGCGGCRRSAHRGERRFHRPRPGSGGVRGRPSGSALRSAVAATIKAEAIYIDGSTSHAGPA